MIDSGATPTDRHSMPTSSTGVTRHASLPTASNNATPASAASSTSPASLQTSSEQHDSFDDFDDDVVDATPMQPIGTCVALYPFDGTMPLIVRGCTNNGPLTAVSFWVTVTSDICPAHVVQWSNHLSAMCSRA